MPDVPTTRFTTNGFVVFPDLIPADTIDALRREADRVRNLRIATMTATAASDPRVTWWRLPTGQPYLLKIKPVLDLSPTAAAVADGTRTVAADLLRAAPQVIDNKFMYKQILDVNAAWAELPILAEEVCKHTDAAYYAGRGFQRVVTIAVCLDPCTERSGALRVWPGSHNRPVAMVHTDRQGPVVADNDAPDSEAVPLIATPGTVLAWDSALIHASGPNTSGNPRRLLVLGYAAPGDGPG
jgi:hypothetical protein